jgi:hypothetical protein
MRVRGCFAYHGQWKANSRLSAARSCLCTNEPLMTVHEEVIFPVLVVGMGLRLCRFLDELIRAYAFIGPEYTQV